MLESLSLDGTSVVITGGGTGLRRSLVRDMARAGGALVTAGSTLGRTAHGGMKSLATEWHLLMQQGLRLNIHLMTRIV